MADDADPYVNPQPTVTVAPQPQDYGDPRAYAAALAEHKTAFGEREKERQQVEAKQQLNTDQMSTLLEDAVKTIRKNREGRSNLPMMAFGAGMLGTPGDFGTQLGGGVRAMIPQIEKQRADEDSTEITLAKLGTQAGEIRDMPLKTKLDYLKALQVGDMATIRAIEAAQIRATAQQGNKQGQIDLNTQKAQAAVLQKATAEAQKQLNSLKKDNEYTQQEEEALYKDLLKQQITLQAGGSGMQLNEEFINKALNMPRPGGGTSVNAFPKPEEMKAKGEQLGLPDMPPTYQDMPPKERAALRTRETAAYDKERPKWEEQASIDKGNDDLLREAQSIITNNPQLMGVVAGRGWNVSPEAQRLASILEKVRLSSVPKGQGQITDFERRLIEKAGVEMTNKPEAALQTIQSLRDANNRSTEHRAFMENYYRTYRTLEGASTKWEEYTKSNAGSYVTEKDGKLVPNDKRLPSDVYFKWQRKGSPPGLVKNTNDGKYYIMRDGTPEPL